MFIAAELRFGDKLVTGQPFSADTVIEDTHRLFDGTTVTKKNSGSIYRDRVMPRGDDGVVIKTHALDAHRYTRAVHIVRNPFDAIASYYH